jgi:hypothetical protein
MKTSKIIKSLLSEIILLANHNKIIANNIISIANNFKNEFSNWFNKSNVQKDLLNIPDNAVLGAIKWLDKTRQKSPTLMSRPIVFQELINDPEGLKYTPYLYSMDKVFKSHGSQILEQYSDILDATENFKDINLIDESIILSSLNFIESKYQDYLKSFIDQPFSDDKGKTVKKEKLSRNEKLKSLFMFLCKESGEMLASSLEEYGHNNIASKIRSDPMFMVDPDAMKESRLITSKSNYYYMIGQVQDTAKKILKNIDLKDHEYNYNLLINNAMKFNMVMSDKDYNNFFYNLMLQQGRNIEGKIERFNFPKHEWINPDVISFILLTLNLIMKKIKF